ncbi:MAG: class I SAM-dependent methyltransferase [Pseudomonadota bacterium]
MSEKDAQFWDRSARKYARDPIANMESYAFTLARMQALLKPTDRVLELGAGTSSTARELAPFVEDYLATDISPEMIRIGEEKQGKERLPSLRLQVAHGVAEGDVDAVLALNLLHLLPDLAATLTVIASRLAPGKLFISKTACLGMGPWYARAGLKLLLPAMRVLGKAPQTVLSFTPEELDTAITHAGFALEETHQEAGAIPRRFVVARRL